VVIGYLETIASLGESLLQELHRSDALTSEPDGLAAAAHRLAGAASNFGFQRITDCCRRFELAVTSGDAGVAALAVGVSTAIEAALPFVRGHIAPSSPADTAVRNTTGLPEGPTAADLPLDDLPKHDED